MIDQDELVAALPGLLRYAQNLTRDLNQAEDLVQETVTRALERADTFRGESRLATWLHRVMYHLMVDRSRRDREVVAGDLADEEMRSVLEAWTQDEYTVDAAAVVARAETRAELEDALTRLPFIYRTAVVLHDAVGLTSSEVAEVQQVGLPAAKQRLRRGRMMLVSALASGEERRERLKGVHMRCWDARAKVSDYLDDELPAADRVELETHLQSCPTCPPLYAGLVGARAALGDSSRDPDSVVPDRILRRLRPSAKP